MRLAVASLICVFGLSFFGDLRLVMSLGRNLISHWLFLDQQPKNKSVKKFWKCVTHRNLFIDSYCIISSLWDKHHWMNIWKFNKVLLFWWKNKCFEGNKPEDACTVCLAACVQCTDSIYSHISAAMNGKSGQKSMEEEPVILCPAQLSWNEFSLNSVTGTHSHHGSKLPD